MVCRMAYMFIMMLTGLSIKVLVATIKWLVLEVEPYQREGKSLNRAFTNRSDRESSILFFIPSKLKSKLTWGTSWL